jgi:hypothetical protein
MLTRLLRVSGLFLRASCALSLVALFANASDVPRKPAFVIHQSPAESLTIVAGEPQFLPLNPPRSPLFNECAFCESGRAEWHYDLSMLKHMAYECGFDYLLMRFDRTYRFDTLTVSATYFFSATPQALRFDSSIVRYGTATRTKTLFFPCASCNTGQALSAASIADTSFATKLQLIDKAEAFSRSFSSAMLARNRESGLRIAFSFGLAGASFVLDERTGVSTLPMPVNVHGIDTGCAAYKLAFFFNPSQIASIDKDRGAGPVIRDVTLSYTETQQVSVTFTATSDVGLREARFGADSYLESIYFKGSTREGVTKTLQIDSSHYVLAISVFDLHGNSSTVYYPIFEAKRDAGRQQAAHRYRLTQERIWAEKNAVNQTLYTLGQFDGNIGQWFKAIADALVDQDVHKDSVRDAAMKDAVARKAARRDSTPAPKPLPDTQQTGVEVIGE